MKMNIGCGRWTAWKARAGCLDAPANDECSEFQISSESCGTILPPSVCGPTSPAIFPLNQHQTQNWSRKAQHIFSKQMSSHRSGLTRACDSCRRRKGLCFFDVAASVHGMAFRTSLTPWKLQYDVCKSTTNTKGLILTLPVGEAGGDTSVQKCLRCALQGIECTYNAAPQVSQLSDWQQVKKPNMQDTRGRTLSTICSIFYIVQT